MTDEKPNPSKVQELPFSSDLMELYRYWLEAPVEDRMHLSLEIATVFCAEHDPTDTDFSEEYHSLFEDFLRAQLNFENEAMRLTRIAIHRITDHLEEHSIDLDNVSIEKLSPN